jgi:hypothetical protein
MNKLFHVIGAFFKSLWEAECAIFDGGKSDREYLEAMRVFEQRYEDMDAAGRAEYREIMRRTV